MNGRKLAVITGASRGIGKAVAFRFASEQYDLVLVATNRDELQNLSEQLQSAFGINALAIAGDLQDPGFVKEVIALTEKKFGRIDVLVNNAAWRSIETMRTMNLETWEKTIRICLTAPGFLARDAAALM